MSQITFHIFDCKAIEIKPTVQVRIVEAIGLEIQICDQSQMHAASGAKMESAVNSKRWCELARSASFHLE